MSCQPDPLTHSLKTGLRATRPDPSPAEPALNGPGFVAPRSRTVLARVECAVVYKAPGRAQLSGGPEDVSWGSRISNLVPDIQPGIGVALG